MAEEKWKEGAAALEEWFKTAPNPNSAAYYLLAVAYYQQENYDKALPPAKKAVELMDTPQENWIGMLLALYLQREQYKDAIPLLVRLVAARPETRRPIGCSFRRSTVRSRITPTRSRSCSSRTARTSDRGRRDRRLADLLLFNGVPYRGAPDARDRHREEDRQGRRQALRKARQLLDRGRRARQGDAAARARGGARARPAIRSCGSGSAIAARGLAARCRRARARARQGAAQGSRPTRIC